MGDTVHFVDKLTYWSLGKSCSKETHLDLLNQIFQICNDIELFSLYETINII